ncbi:hypothetical protein [Erythrobacter sp. HKB08]|uniref:hypothetical protein n=1 Tax=Erythrobacter sp. HKB08 TaxID=2502843 RepID=UPI0010086A97|nr:hypothetical protein [Erythrobacter sp. HKB08]
MSNAPELAVKPSDAMATLTTLKLGSLALASLYLAGIAATFAALVQLTASDTRTMVVSLSALFMVACWGGFTQNLKHQFAAYSFLKAHCGREVEEEFVEAMRPPSIMSVQIGYIGLSIAVILAGLFLT